MRIGLITPHPCHPLLSATTALLRPRHVVVWADPGSYGHSHSFDGILRDPLADVYLLKARTTQALARSLEQRGATAVNSAAATGLCQDRTAMAELARRAGLPFAPTRAVPALRQLADEAGPGGPFVVKSRHSRRNDLVSRVDDATCLNRLCTSWADEPVVVQPFIANNGWDHKLWVAADQIFAALRRSELTGAHRGPHLPLTADDLPDGWATLARAVGSVFFLDVYGVDVIDAGGGTPLIVDINAFPGMGGQEGAPRAVAELALRAGAGAPPTRPTGRHVF
ncbi:RimK family alpha-L-glutamate ligase [Streptomyces sp. 35G-GA-8]|uniref:ATP-grasp domain-containing protein n=1 Tax=Streptomyces sp. 35G-GA-8 TaxID=2939434 RepID=UPI00201F3CA2|nr:alpha-L-glutamate ligase [Streptomyces sp. 35G-GA-8]MCL7380444.1 alpha-L-glutamate ligase [Streptomyces sp. 35G-GA-8]